MTQVTVVIPNYNGMRFLENCMNSLYAGNQGAVSFEVLVVDNGSSDGSVAYLQENYPEVRLVALPENTGFCHAVNVGIEQSESPYVILLNNDTKVLEGFVGNLYEAIKDRDEVFSVSAKMLMWDKPELLDDAGDQYCVLGWAYARGKGKPAEQYDKAVRIFSACGGAAIYSRKILNEVGLFDELHFAYLEDLDLGYRARIYGYENLYEPKAQVIHFGSASSGSRYNEWKTKMASANSVYVIGKNMPLLQWLLNLPFLLIGFLVKAAFFTVKGYGGIYVKGLGRGLARCFSKEGRQHKVRFRLAHLGHYLRIQLCLYANTLKFLKKS